MRVCVCVLRDDMDKDRSSVKKSRMRFLTRGTRSDASTRPRAPTRAVTYNAGLDGDWPSAAGAVTRSRLVPLPRETSAAAKTSSGKFAAAAAVLARKVVVVCRGGLVATAAAAVAGSGDESGSRTESAAVARVAPARPSRAVAVAMEGLGDGVGGGGLASILCMKVMRQLRAVTGGGGGGCARKPVAVRVRAAVKEWSGIVWWVFDTHPSYVPSGHPASSSVRSTASWPKARARP